jgi:hypothetical protein
MKITKKVKKHKRVGLGYKVWPLGGRYLGAPEKKGLDELVHALRSLAGLVVYPPLPNHVLVKRRAPQEPDHSTHALKHFNFTVRPTVSVRIRIQLVLCSVADPDPDPPDPHIFGPPGFGSISQRYGSGSFYH